MKTYEELLAMITTRGVHEVFGAYGEGYGIEQNPEELAQFLVVCQELGVSSILEIGTGYKAGLARFLHDDMQWAVTSVDIKDYRHQYGGIRFLTWEQVQDLDEAAGFYGLGAHDLILIDGDHTYNAVAHDHAYYAQFTPKVIAFHDIAGLRDCEGVAQYWDEIALEEVPDQDAPRGYIYDFRPGYHVIMANTLQRGGIGYIVLSEVEVSPPIAFSGDASYPIDPDSSGTVTHEVAEWELEAESKAKKPATPRKRTPAKKPAARTAKK